MPDPSGAVVDPGSETVLLRVEQAGAFHQGGTIRFGPDGYLWMSFGDGGGTEQDPIRAGLMQDQLRHGQNPHSLQASVIRIDVDSGDPYSIPETNPFADGVAGAPEVWAHGLRNPWQVSFDGDTIFIADVGHVTWEEINVARLSAGGGINFGWSAWEGPDCYYEDLCAAVDNIVPAVAIARRDACALIGGFVYRGSAIPQLVGEYFYADHCTGWIRTARLSGRALTESRVLIEPIDGVPRLTSFAVDNDGELYVISMDGKIFRIEASR